MTLVKQNADVADGNRHQGTFRLRSYSAGPMRPAQMKNAVDQAKASRGQCIFMVTTKSSETTGVLLSDHLALADYSPSQDVDKKPVSEVVRGAAD